jgi:hypothetical protein
MLIPQYALQILLDMQNRGWGAKHAVNLSTMTSEVTNAASNKKVCIKWEESTPNN